MTNLRRGGGDVLRSCPSIVTTSHALRSKRFRDLADGEVRLGVGRRMGLRLRRACRIAGLWLCLLLAIGVAYAEDVGLQKQKIIRDPAIMREDPTRNCAVDTLAAQRIQISSESLNRRATYRVAPQFPQLAQLARIKGVIVVEPQVDTHGRVTCVRVIRGHPLLLLPVIDAVRQWTFRPLERAHKAVPFRGQLSFTFPAPNSARK